MKTAQRIIFNKILFDLIKKCVFSKILPNGDAHKLEIVIDQLIRAPFEDIFFGDSKTGVKSEVHLFLKKLKNF